MKGFFYFKIPYHKPWVCFSLQQSFEEIWEEVSVLGLTEKEFFEYKTFRQKGLHIDARTKLFMPGEEIKHDPIVLVKMNFYDESLHMNAVLLHECGHAAKRLLDAYESEHEDRLENREEAECYTLEFIFEQIMMRLRPKIDYTKIGYQEQKDLDWFKQITTTLV